MMFHLPDPVYRICGWLALFYRFAFRAALCAEPTARDEGKLKTHKKGTNEKQRRTHTKKEAICTARPTGIEGNTLLERQGSRLAPQQQQQHNVLSHEVGSESFVLL